MTTAGGETDLRICTASNTWTHIRTVKDTETRGKWEKKNKMKLKHSLAAFSYHLPSPCHGIIEGYAEGREARNSASLVRTVVLFKEPLETT